MSEQITEVEPVAEVEPVVEQEPEKDLADEVEKWKAMSRKNEARAKENESAAKRLAEIEEANKTELEKAIARAEAAEKAIQEREEADERARVAAEVATEFGIDAGVLRGATRDELEEHAKQIKSLIPKTPKSPGDFASGDVGDPIAGPKQITSRDQLKNMTPAEIVAAQERGELAQLMGAK